MSELSSAELATLPLKIFVLLVEAAEGAADLGPGPGVAETFLAIAANGLDFAGGAVAGVFEPAEKTLAGWGVCGFSLELRMSLKMDAASESGF